MNGAKHSQIGEHERFEKCVRNARWDTYRKGVKYVFGNRRGDVLPLRSNVVGARTQSIWFPNKMHSWLICDVWATFLPKFLNISMFRKSHELSEINICGPVSWFDIKTWYAVVCLSRPDTPKFKKHLLTEFSVYTFSAKGDIVPFLLDNLPRTNISH